MPRWMVIALTLPLLALVGCGLQENPEVNNAIVDVAETAIDSAEVIGAAVTPSNPLLGTTILTLAGAAGTFLGAFLRRKPRLPTPADAPPDDFPEKLVLDRKH